MSSVNNSINKEYLVPNMNIDIEEVSIGEDKSFVMYDDEFYNNTNNDNSTDKHNCNNFNLLKTMGTRPIQFRDDISITSSEDIRMKSRKSFHLMVSGTSNQSSNSNLNLTVLNTPNSSLRNLSGHSCTS